VGLRDSQKSEQELFCVSLTDFSVLLTFKGFSRTPTIVDMQKMKSST